MKGEDSSMPVFGIATNVSAIDPEMALHTIPSWLRVFGDRLREVLILVDPKSVEGRIARSHEMECLGLIKLHEKLASLKETDDRIRVDILEYDDLFYDHIRTWFRKGRPVRCQDGTPVGAFVSSVQRTTVASVMHCDADMLFHDDGWVERALALVESEGVDLVEPPHLGGRRVGSVSNNAWLINKPKFTEKCLPMVAHRLDAVRRLHRRLLGRSTYLALSQMLTEERQAGRVKHRILPTDLGFSFHIASRKVVNEPGFEKLVRSVEVGQVPDGQWDAGWTFERQAWPENLGSISHLALNRSLQPPR